MDFSGTGAGEHSHSAEQEALYHTMWDKISPDWKGCCDTPEQIMIAILCFLQRSGRNELDLSHCLWMSLLLTQMSFSTYGCSFGQRVSALFQLKTESLLVGLSLISRKDGNRNQ